MGRLAILCCALFVSIQVVAQLDEQEQRVARASALLYRAYHDTALLGELCGAELASPDSELFKRAMAKWSEENGNIVKIAQWVDLRPYEAVPGARERFEKHWKELYEGLSVRYQKTWESATRDKRLAYCAEGYEALVSGKLEIKHTQPDAYALVDTKGYGYALEDKCTRIGNMASFIIYERSKDSSRDKAIAAALRWNETQPRLTGGQGEASILTRTITPISDTLYSNDKVSQWLAHKYGFWRCMVQEAYEYTNGADQRLITAGKACQEKPLESQHRSTCFEDAVHSITADLKPALQKKSFDMPKRERGNHTYFTQKSNTERSN